MEYSQNLPDKVALLYESILPGRLILREIVCNRGRFKVVVTGAAGKIGRWVVRKLLDSEYEVIGSDRILREESATEYFVQADLRDYGQACQLGPVWAEVNLDHLSRLGIRFNKPNFIVRKAPYNKFQQRKK